METLERPTSQAPNMSEKLSQAATTIGNSVARASALLPELPGGFAEFIRRHPLPSLMVGLGLGFLLGRSCMWSTTKSSTEENLDQSEAGYPNALIQCLRCGQMIRQADMVSHSTTCKGVGMLSHGGSPS